MQDINVIISAINFLIMWSKKAAAAVFVVLSQHL